MHTNPEVLVLLALGENPGSGADHHHLRNCAFCQSELAELRHVTSLARAGSWEEGRLQEPSKRVWHSIEQELATGSSRSVADTSSTETAIAVPRGSADRAEQPPATTPQNPPVVSTENLPLPAPQEPPPSAPVTSVSPPAEAAAGSTAGSTREVARGGRLLSLALAAGIALVAGVGIGIAWDRFRSAGQIVGQASLQALPDWPGAAGTAVVREDDRGNRTLIVTMTTPQPVDGNRQVWLLTPDARGMQPVGFITGDRGFWAIPGGMDLTRFPLVDVSDEPPNDPDAAHSGNSIVRGRLAS